MVEQISEEELYKRQFIGFVALLANSAMQQLGKLVNPLTGKIERSLEGARATIGMIKMLQVKTKGNLSPEEQQAIDSSLSTLQLNYADEAGRKDEAQPPTEEPPQSEKPDAEAPDPAPDAKD
jgi:hypothetical protein